MTMAGPFKVRNLSTSGGIAGPFKSLLSGIVSEWLVNPTISGGPWPGGTVTGTTGTLSEGIASYVYKINGTSTDDISYTSFVPAASEYSGSLTLVGDAGGIIATSNALTLQRLRGVTRPVMNADYLTTASFALPADGVTFLIECVGYESAGNVSIGLVLQGGPIRYISLQTSADGQSLIGEIATASATVSATVAVGAELLDGATRWFAQVTYDGAEVRIRYAASGDVVSQTAAAALTGSLASTCTLTTGGLVDSFSGSYEIKVLERTLNDVAFLAVVASPIGIASLDGDADILVEYMPTPGTEAQEDSITVGTQIDPTVTINAGSARMIAGRLNAGDALTAPVWLVNPYITGENWPGGTLTGVGVVTPGAISSATYDWELDTVPSGNDSRFRLVGLSELGVEFVWAGIATNVLGSTPSDSTAVEIVQVEGLIRASPTSKFLRKSSSIGSAGAIVCHARLTAVAGTSILGPLLSIGRESTSPDRYAIEIYKNTSTGNLQVSVYFGPNAPTGIDTGLALPAVDGITDYYVIVEWSGGTSFTAYVAEPGGSWSSYSWVPAGSPAHSTSIQVRAWVRVVVDPVTSPLQSAGMMEGVVLNRVTTSDERDDILAAGNLAESGIFAATGILASLRPVGTVAVDGASATGAGVVGSWTVAGAGTDVVYGGMNVEV